MKAVILAGGLGTRLSEETVSRPKPMVEVGGRPVLWHILQIYASHGINDFIICCGYKGHVIKEYFANFNLHHSDVTFDFTNHSIEYHARRTDPWRVTLVDTGDNTLTGGRLKRVADHLKDEEAFCFTYGDGVGDVDVTAAIKFHKSHGRLATLTAAAPPGRFGALNIHNGQVARFEEKPKGDGALVNAGYFVLSPKVVDYIEGDHTTWEQEPLAGLAEAGELIAFEHHGFWQPMDTLRDKQVLEKLWTEGRAPWKTWA
jgi:glucose-1-phosphate cytidylyltransferase